MTSDTPNQNMSENQTEHHLMQASVKYPHVKFLPESSKFEKVRIDNGTIPEARPGTLAQSADALQGFVLIN